MSIEFDSNDEMFRFVSKEGVGLTHSQGYFWFWRKFMPALENAVASESCSNELIADCYYVAGDVHDFNAAPKAAIRCYKKALQFDPECNAAYREIASMLGRMGEYEKALSYSEKALALNPDDSHAIRDREEYVAENRLLPPLFKKGDYVWAAYELLAASHPKAAMKALKKKKGARAKRAVIHCYGVLERTQDYLAAWKELVSSVAVLEFTYADWFFMEDSVYSKPDLWEIFLSSRAEYKGVFAVFAGLDESDRYRSLSTHEKIRLRLKYYVYVQSGDFERLRKLYVLYPEWVELREMLSS